MHCKESRMPSRPGSSTQRLNAKLNNYDDHIKYSRSIGILYRQKASSSVSLIFFSALRLRPCLVPYTYQNIWNKSRWKEYMSKLIRFIRTTQKCSKLKVSPHFEELGVMQDSSILRYLCSSCCQKFPETGDKNLLIPTFPTNLAQGACVQEKSYEENSILFHFRILSRCG